MASKNKTTAQREAAMRELARRDVAAGRAPRTGAEIDAALVNDVFGGGDNGVILMDEQPTFRCDSCQAAMINGVFCHETGCPNTRKTWVPDREQWVRFVECSECGSDVEEGETCCTDEEETYAADEAFIPGEDDAHA